jgi:hypothetical protein
MAVAASAMVAGVAAPGVAAAAAAAPGVTASTATRGSNGPRQR